MVRLDLYRSLFPTSVTLERGARTAGIHTRCGPTPIHGARLRPGAARGCPLEEIRLRRLVQFPTGRDPPRRLCVAKAKTFTNCSMSLRQFPRLEPPHDVRKFATGGR